MSLEELMKYREVMRIYSKYKELREILGIKPINPYDPKDVIRKLSGEQLKKMMKLSDMGYEYER